jgi:hypothetical protein
MNKTLIAAMSGTAFGLLLGANLYQFCTHVCRHQGPRIVQVVQAPAPALPSASPEAVAGPGSMNFQRNTPAASIEVDLEADQNLALARELASSDPNRAKRLCRKTMQLYNNCPHNARVVAAFKLFNTIQSQRSDE